MGSLLVVLPKPGFDDQSPSKGRFLPGGTLVVRNVLSGGAENEAVE
jgi:hypothetical protein